MGEATKGIMQKARMARDLYRQQADIESRVKERWGSFFCPDRAGSSSSRAKILVAPWRATCTGSRRTSSPVSWRGAGPAACLVGNRLLFWLLLGRCCDDSRVGDRRGAGPEACLVGNRLLFWLLLGRCCDDSSVGDRCCYFVYTHSQRKRHSPSKLPHHRV